MANTKKETMVFYRKNERGRSFILELLFDKINRLFYEGKLPAARVYWYKFRRKNFKGATAWNKDKTLDAIYINIDLKESRQYAIQTLVHESIHVAKPSAGHGPAFEKEKKRLYDAGAYLHIV